MTTTSSITNSSIPPNNCKFAIPKKGRLFEKVTEILRGAGLDYQRRPRLDVALCSNLPITLVFLPASDIAKYVGEGNVDMGITGFDVVQESNVHVNHVMDLGFGKCTLCLQAPITDQISNVSTIAGGRIVTSFPFVTKQFFQKLDTEQKVTTTVTEVSGSVEAACDLGLADAIVDLVETGTTMRAAGLEIIAEVLQSQAILISNVHSEHIDTVNLIKRRIEGYITATKYVMLSYNVRNELLHEAITITPGKKSPTVTNLDDTRFKAVSCLVEKEEVSMKMDDLHELGAMDILTFQLTNSRM